MPTLVNLYNYSYTNLIIQLIEIFHNYQYIVRYVDHDTNVTVTHQHVTLDHHNIYHYCYPQDWYLQMMEDYCMQIVIVVISSDLDLVHSVLNKLPVVHPTLPRWIESVRDFEMVMSERVKVSRRKNQTNQGKLSYDSTVANKHLHEDGAETYLHNTDCGINEI